MKFIVSSSDLLKNLQVLGTILNTNNTLPILDNFLFEIVGMSGDWTPSHFVSETIAKLKAKLGNDKVLLGLSGGVDSSVAALLLHRAIGKNLYCIFVNNGLLRKNEYADVLEQYKGMGLNVKGQSPF